MDTTNTDSTPHADGTKPGLVRATGSPLLIMKHKHNDRDPDAEAIVGLVIGTLLTALAIIACFFLP